jgi:hypothetical protein
VTAIATLLTEIRDGLNDVEVPYRWSDAELVRYINAGVRQIIVLQPEANIVERRLSLALSARQTLPAAGVKFVRVSANSPAPDTRGAQIRYVERDALDTFEPAWETISATGGQLVHYLHDPREPGVFYVYPVPTQGMHAYVVFSEIPAAAAANGDSPLSAVFDNGLIEYAVYRALTKDSRYGVSGERATQLYNKFLLAINEKPVVEYRVGPQANKPPGGS